MADFICLTMATQYTEESSSSIRNPLFRRSSSSQRNEPKVHVRIVPSIENPSRSLIFSIIERDLEAGKVIKIGRFTDKSSVQNHISFKSKVVSRSHCEVWLNHEGKVLLKDTKSSSGTFVNHVRLSPANQESRPVEIRDGDLVQLGVDYQGGFEEIYRAVKMRFEVNRQSQAKQISYSISAFNNLRNITSNKQLQLTASSDNIQVEECCICLYALAPFQALFVAPCSHTYHFKCIRPLLDSYPGFQCPICRTYSDLDASVAMEIEEVIEKFGLRKNTHAQTQGDHCPSSSSSSSSDAEEEEEILHPLPTQAILSDPPLSTTLVACTNSLSGMMPPSSNNTTSNDIEAIMSDAEDHHRANIGTSASAAEQKQKNTKYNNNLVEKIKMAFSNDKRRSIAKKRMNSTGTTNSCSSSDEMERSETYFDLSTPTSIQHLNHTLSRQSTHHNNLSGIVEELASNASH
ncbi:hypothetical protein RMATCC62417_09006 [Rhizopus microsporus]|nr:hypothetical protein RMATCC62417_09006 [Rhizopus microsporus]CEI96225.1 hypothetical protein RMCBS344292_10391 [Rhizopus microsporus]